VDDKPSPGKGSPVGCSAGKLSPASHMSSGKQPTTNILLFNFL